MEGNWKCSATLKTCATISAGDNEERRQATIEGRIIKKKKVEGGKE